MTTLNNFKQKRIEAEIKELRECIEVIDYNLSNGLYNVRDQVTMRNRHLDRIAELESPETPMDMRLH
jgi:hypothetical protein